MTKLVKCGDCDKFIDKKDIVFVLHEFDENGSFKTQIRNNDKIGVCKKHTDKCSVCNNLWLEDNIRGCKECGLLLCDFHKSYCNICYDCICEKCFYKIHLKKDTICKDCGNRYSFFFEKCADAWHLSWCFNCDSEEVFNDYLKQNKYLSEDLSNYCPIPLGKFASLFTK